MNYKRSSKNLFLASPRGFCAGVERAISIVEKSIEIYGKPIYVKHEIVHNKHVVERLSNLGAIFIENIDEVPVGSKIVFSAHGVAEKVKNELNSVILEGDMVGKTLLIGKRYFCMSFRFNFTLYS